VTRREDRDPPRVGFDALLPHERAFRTSIQSVRVTRNRPLSYGPRVYRSRSAFAVPLAHGQFLSARNNEDAPLIEDRR